MLAVFFDRLVGLLALMCVAGATILLNLKFVGSEPALISLAVMIWAGILCVMVGGYLAVSQRVRSYRWVRRLLASLPFQDFWKTVLDTADAFKEHRGRVAGAFFVSVAIHLMVVTGNIFLLLVLTSQTLPLSGFFVLVPMAQVIQAIPITPGSWGAAEAAYAMLFGLMGLSIGAEVSLLQRLTYYIWAILGCGIYLGYRRRKRLETSEAAGSGLHCSSKAHEAANNLAK